MDDFIEYVDARWPRLVRSAVLMGCTHSEAEDIVQTTLERCLTKWSRVQRAGDREAYVHKALFNTFVSARRRRWTNEHPKDYLPEVSSSDETERIDTADAMLRALDRLPPGQRHVVVLRFYAHFDVEQCANVLGVAPGTVKSRLSRALKALEADMSLRDLRGVR